MMKTSADLMERVLKRIGLSDEIEAEQKREAEVPAAIAEIKELEARRDRELPKLQRAVEKAAEKKAEAYRAYQAAAIEAGKPEIARQEFVFSIERNLARAYATVREHAPTAAIHGHAQRFEDEWQATSKRPVVTIVYRLKGERASVSNLEPLRARLNACGKARNTILNDWRERWAFIDMDAEAQLMWDALPDAGTPEVPDGAIPDNFVGPDWKWEELDAPARESAWVGAWRG